MSDISTVYDLLDAAAKRFPIKALCDNMGKAESTLRGELNRQAGHKLSLSDALLIIKQTKDLTALDAIEEMASRVAFNIPSPEPGDTIQNIITLISSLSREFARETESLARALSDGVINKKEAQRCLAMNKALIKECLKIEAHLERLY
jgi:hypothetical protein